MFQNVFEFAKQANFAAIMKLVFLSFDFVELFRDLNRVGVLASTMQIERVSRKHYAYYD